MSTNSTLRYRIGIPRVESCVGTWTLSLNAMELGSHERFREVWATKLVLHPTFSLAFHYGCEEHSYKPSDQGLGHLGELRD